MIIDKDKLKQHLKEGEKTITFIKADGSQRVMRCTLQEWKLPPVDPNKTVVSKPPNTETLVVWDLDNQGWRSFRYESIISVL